MEATSFVDIFNIAATSVKEAVDKYGEQTVDLGLMVYRLSALQSILLGLFGLVFLITLLIPMFRGFPKIRAWIAAGERYSDREAIWVLVVIGYVVALPFSLLLILKGLFDIYAWAAVFGYPEVLIAAKALASAGLLN